LLSWGQFSGLSTAALGVGGVAAFFSSSMLLFYCWWSWIWVF
jgi:hypothetical protein